MSVSQMSSPILALTLIVCGCGDSARELPKPTSPSLVSDEEALALGYDVEDAIRNQDVKALIALFDFAELQRSIDREPLNDTIPSATIPDRDEILRTRVRETRVMITERLEAVFVPFSQVATSCSLVGLRDRDDGKRLVLRIVGRGECLTYVEFRFARTGDGVYLADGYFHPLGESLSDFLRMDAPTADIRVEIENLKRRKILREKMTAARGRDAQEILKLYKELPWDEDSRRTCLVPLLMVSPSLGDTDFAMAVDEARQHFPNDLQVNLSLAWAFESREGGLEALGPIDRANEVIGGDPYLLAWKAGFLTGAGKLDEAKALVAELLEESPLDWDTLRASLWNCLQRKDYVQATQVMDVIRRDFEDDSIDQIDFDGMGEFTESPAYKAWVTAKKQD